MESLSVADIYTDYLILKQLYVYKHQFWATFMALLMIAPYLVCFAVLGSIFHKYIDNLTAVLKGKKQDSAVDEVTERDVLSRFIRETDNAIATQFWKSMLCLQLVRETSRSCQKKLKITFISFMYFLWLSPVSIIYFAAIDALFMIYTLLNTALLLGLTIIGVFVDIEDCFHKTEQIMDVITDRMFLALFQMNKAQTIGYRRMRTLSQV